jgi:hypothetical protein
VLAVTVHDISEPHGQSTLEKHQALDPTRTTIT